MDIPPLVISAFKVHDRTGNRVNEYTPEIQDALKEESRALCSSSGEVSLSGKLIQLQTGDIWSLGRTNLNISGKFRCLGRQNGILSWRFVEGKVTMQGDRFDFSPLIGNREPVPAGDIVNGMGWAAQNLGGWLMRFDINLPGTIQIDTSGSVKCSQ